ncbi:MAG: hypothetical protein M1812_002119 [Candelaria pacifica]|nr:MAG: hypothetical protein M1812_002119 [Candelaria pacifica]
MPSKYSFFKSNRSQASLLETQDQQPQGQRSSGRSPLASPGLSSGPSPPQAQVAQDHRFDQRGQEESGRNQYFSGAPARRQSQRLTAGYPGPTVNLVTNPQDDPAQYTEEPRRGSHAPIHSLEAHHDQDTKKSKRSIFGFGSAASKENQRSNAVNDQPQAQQRVSQGSIGRSISVRRKDPPPALKQSTRQSPTDDQHHHFSGKHNSATLLPPSSEEEEVGPQVEPVGQSPPVPAKDSFGRPATLKPPAVERQQGWGALPRKVSDFGIEDQPHYNRNEFILPPRDQSLQGSPLFPPDPHAVSHDSPQYHAYQPPLLNTANTPLSHNQRLLPLDLPSPSAYHSQAENQHGRPPSQASSQLQYQAYDPQAHNQGHPIRRAPSEEAQDSMAPPGPPRQVSRPAGGIAPNAPNGPPREVSSLQPHEQGTQGQMQPPTPNAPQFTSPPPAAGQPNQNYRGGPPHQQQPGQPGELGRSTPPLSRPTDDSTNLDIAEKLARYDELQTKYSKVKKYYFEKDAQVHQLQNTLAHQRLAQSRTSLDDSEYATRFNRLDGAINNLAFNIRKDWKAIPPWLAPFVNQDAHKIGTKEMTAIGRACISKWIVDEILERYFHPGLEPTLSSQLKIIEKNVRKFAPPTHSSEEDDALLAKISNWRLTTLDGLTEMMSSPQSLDYRTSLTETLVTKLIASLQMNLKDPPPPGLEGGVSMIVELAVGIAANLPLESRDVYVEYPLAGAPVNPDYMKVETGLPALTNPGASAENVETDKSSLSGADAASQISDPKDATLEQGPRDADSSSMKEHPKKKGMFGGLMNKKPPSSQGGDGLQKPTDGSQVSLGQQGQRPTSSAGQREVEVQRVRFAAFMAVEVRGRSILVKAPVYT